MTEETTEAGTGYAVLIRCDAQIHSQEDFPVSGHPLAKLFGVTERDGFSVYYSAGTVEADGRDEARDVFIEKWEREHQGQEFPEGITIKTVALRYSQGEKTIRYKRDRVAE